MFPIETGIKLNSDVNAVGGNIAHMRLRFEEPIKIPDDHNLHFMKIHLGKIPFTVKNISSSLGNNTIRYSMNGGTGYTVITIPEGTYDVVAINKYFLSVLNLNGDWEYNPVNQIRQYPWEVGAMESSSHGRIQINPEYSTYTQVIVDLTNNSTSTFYQLLGFTAGEAVLDGSVATESIATNNVDIIDAQFSINCNLVRSYTSSGRRIGRTLMEGIFDVVPNGYKIINDTDNVLATLIQVREIREIEIEIVDRNGNYVVFHDTSRDGNVFLQFYIY